MLEDEFSEMLALVLGWLPQLPTAQLCESAPKRDPAFAQRNNFK